MSKIKLVVEHLQVESFGTGPAGELRGTVHANVTAYWELCHQTQTEDPQVNTCGQTQNSCVYTCFEPTCYQCNPGTAACGTQDPNLNTCGVSCVARCNFTEQPAECEL